MVQSININQFTITTIKGDLASTQNPNVIEAQIVSTSNNLFYGATAVKLVSNAGGIPLIEKATDSLFGNGNIFGFVIRNLKKGVQQVNNGVGDVVSVAFSGCIMQMEAGGNITAGNLLHYNPTGDVVTYLNTTGEWGIGYALRNAALGDIFPVLICTPTRLRVE